MKRKPFKNHGLCTPLSVFVAFIVYSSYSQLGETAVVSERRSQRNSDYATSESNGSSEIVSSSEASKRPEISAVVGKSVFIPCNLNKTTGSNCEWYKKEPNGPSELRIMNFVGRYEAVTPCKLLIRPVTFEDEGTFICKVKTGGSSSKYYHSQLTVTGQDDPFGNAQVKKSLYTSPTPPLPNSEPEISKDLFVKGGVYTVEPGGNIQVRCGATGNPKPLVLWRRGSQNYTKSTEGHSDLKIFKPTTDDAGTYHCEAVNIFGKVEHAITIDVRASLNAASEIIDITPRNLSIYEGKLANLTCIARFEAQPFIWWVKRVDNRTTEPNLIEHEGRRYSVFQQAERRTLGQHLYASTLLLPNVTIANSGQYFCIVAGRQGYNVSEANIIVEKDPIHVHLTQTRKHKMITFLWIGVFFCVSILVVLAIIRLFGCPNAASNKSLHSKSSSEATSNLKTQLPKRSPETLSTDCTNTRHDAFPPIGGHESCSFVSPDPSLFYKDYSSSCRTFNSYDPEFSLSLNSSTNSVAMASLEAARSSCSNCHNPGSNDYYSEQSVPSPSDTPFLYHHNRQHTAIFDPSRQTSSGPQRYFKYRQRYAYQAPSEISKGPYLPHEVEGRSERNPPEHCNCAENYCGSHVPCSMTTSCCDDYPHSPGNLLLTSESEWYLGDCVKRSPQSSHQYCTTSVVEDQSESDSYVEEDEEAEERRYSFGRTDQRLSHPSPNLSFLEQLRSNPNTITAIL